MNSVALVGNRPITGDVSDKVDAHTLVVRMGNARSLLWKMTGSKIDVLAIRNHDLGIILLDPAYNIDPPKLCTEVWVLEQQLNPELTISTLQTLGCIDKPRTILTPQISWPAGSQPDIGYIVLEHVLQSPRFSGWQIGYCGLPIGPPDADTPGGFAKHHDIAETARRVQQDTQQGRITEVI